MLLHSYYENMWIFGIYKAEIWFKGFHLYAFYTTTELKISPQKDECIHQVLWIYKSFPDIRNFVTLSSKYRGIHSFSGTNIHILKYTNAFYKSKISLWNFCKIFLTLPQSPLSQWKLCAWINPIEWGKPEKNGANYKNIQTCRVRLSYPWCVPKGWAKKLF